MNETVSQLVQALRLQRHPEGGWYRETWRAAESIQVSGLPARFSGERSHGTAIYYLLAGADFSALHRICSDELWHYHAGATLLIHIIDPDGRHRIERLGADIDRGDRFQVVVPHGSWFGAVLEDTTGFALAGCTVAPGFDFADFEMGRKEELLSRFPLQQSIIEQLTRP